LQQCENEKGVRNVCIARGITMEFTAPGTPQQNSIAERAFVTIQNCNMAMMIDAKLKPEFQHMLWSKVYQTATHTGNALIPTSGIISSDEKFCGVKPNILQHLIEFGCVGMVTKKKNKNDG
jgi:hypothetical protein